MIKKIIIFSAVIILSACSANPPKVGTTIKVETVPIISERSSDALKDIAKYGAIGVRDLTVKEFSKFKSDVEKLDKVSSARTGVGTSYHVGTGALAIAGGMAFDSVLGIGLLSAMLEDKRPDNYEFARDFNSSPRLYSKNGVSIEVLRKAHKEALQAYLEYVLPALKMNVPKETKESEDKDKGRFGESAWLYDGARSFRAITSSYCVDGDKNCSVYYDSYYKNSPTPYENLFLIEIALRLPSDYMIYLPPNRAVYRLPSVIYGETAEIKYLVENNN